MPDATLTVKTGKEKTQYTSTAYNNELDAQASFFRSNDLFMGLSAITNLSITDRKDTTGTHIFNFRLVISEHNNVRRFSIDVGVRERDALFKRGLALEENELPPNFFRQNTQIEDFKKKLKNLIETYIGLELRRATDLKPRDFSAVLLGLHLLQRVQDGLKSGTLKFTPPAEQNILRT
jgi:hypothetical protein